MYKLMILICVVFYEYQCWSSYLKLADLLLYSAPMETDYGKWLAMMEAGENESVY